MCTQATWFTLGTADPGMGSTRAPVGQEGNRGARAPDLVACVLTGEAPREEGEGSPLAQVSGSRGGWTEGQRWG